MKCAKLFAAGLMSAVLLTSNLTACSDKNDVQEDITSEETVKETVEETKNSNEANKPEDTSFHFDEDERLSGEEGRNYGDDFKGSTKVSDETEDLYTNSDNMIKEGIYTF